MARTYTLTTPFTQYTLLDWLLANLTTVCSLILNEVVQELLVVKLHIVGMLPP